jgi:hypothetical protein
MAWACAAGMPTGPTMPTINMAPLRQVADTVAPACRVGGAIQGV